jgi:hypothetical protein
MDGTSRPVRRPRRLQSTAWRDRSRAHGGNAFRGKSGALRVLADELLVCGEVYAVDLVVRDEALDPLDVGSELIEDDSGRRRRFVQLVSAERPDSGNRALDHVFLHGYLRLR